MTRDEAEALDLELNRHLKNCSEDMGIEEPFYDCVMGNIIGEKGYDCPGRSFILYKARKHPIGFKGVYCRWD